ncbi:hypothetical protein BDA96_01G174800 [Sorghum bicolor]|uniref:Uncharacterized protein n=1 Tax=Sorghum bicolor TaxID=4558 RepID=A0A921RZL2_SORBI|nr:hypothetical protein BDA96_01G174800 [Sorghum bicolor]
MKMKGSLWVLVLGGEAVGGEVWVCVCWGGGELIHQWGGHERQGGEGDGGCGERAVAEGGQGGEGGGQRGSQKWRRGNGWLSWGRGRRGGRRDCMGKD